MEFRFLRKAVLGLGICIALQSCTKEDPEASNLLQVQAYLSLADVYKNQGQFRASVIETQNAFDLMPQNVDVMSFIGGLYLEIGDVNQAVQQIDAALKILPDSAQLKLLKAEALLAMNQVSEGLQLVQGLQTPADLVDRKEWLEASLLAASGNVDSAKAQFEKVLGRNANHVPSLIAMAKLAYLAGDVEQANTFTSRASSAGGDLDEDFWLWKGQLAMLQENYPDAEVAYKEALDIMASYDIMTAKKFAALQSVLVPLQMQQKNDEALQYSQIIASTPQGEFNSAYSNVLSLFQQGSVSEAEGALKTLLESAPTHPGSNILLGLSKFSEGNFSEAQRLLTQYVDAETASPQLVGTLAATHLQTGQPDKALSVLQEALTASPENADLLVMIGTIQNGMGRIDDALASLNSAKDKSPDSANIYVALANVHLQRNDMQEAIKSLDSAIELAPEQPQAKSQLLGLLVRENDTNAAQERVKKWLGADANSALNNMLAGVLNLELKNFSSARDYFNKVLTIDANNVQAELYLARADIGEEKYSAAADRFNNILATQPANPDAISGILALGDLTKSPQASVSRITKLIEGNPQEFVPGLLLSQYYLVNRDLPNALLSAEKAYGTAQNQFTRSLYLETLNQSAIAAIQAQKGQDAAPLLEKALTIDAENLQTLSLLAGMSAAEGKFAEAMEQVSKIRSLQPEGAYSHELEGDLLLAQKKPTEALVAYQAGWQKEKSPTIGMKIYQAHRSVNANDEATKFLEQWLGESSNIVAPNLLMGMEMQSAQKDSDAIRYYEEVFKLDPNNMIMLNNLAWLYQDSAPQRAMELAAKAADLYPENADVLDTYGWILHRQGNNEKAREVLESGLKISPDSAAIKEHIEALN